MARPVCVVDLPPLAELLSLTRRGMLMMMPPCRFLSRVALLVAMCGAVACSRQAETPCIFQDDCALPYEYCSAATDTCTAYECLEDAECAKTERCSLITNTCILRPRPDMALDMPDLGPPDMGPPDMGPPDFGPPDLGPPDLGPPDLGPPVDRTPPEILSLSPPPGTSIDFGDERPDTIRVLFDEPLYALSLSSFTVSLIDELGNEVPLELRYDEMSREGVITTSPGAARSRSYQLKLSREIRDVAGNMMERDRSYLFYTTFTRDEEDYALATRWAPIIHQELQSTTLNAWRHDVPSRVDFDGDWTAANNLEHVEQLAEGAYRASIYYHVVSTPSHHFITYALYYPSRTLLDQDTMQQEHHEHDFTGILLVVERGSEELLLVEGIRVEQGTDLLIAFLNADRDVDLPGQGRIRGEFSRADLFDDTHYPLYVPAGRHEACNWNDAQVRPPFDVCVHPSREFRAGLMGVTMTHAEQGQGLEHASQATPDAPFTMTYALLPFEDSFWTRRDFIGPHSLYERGFTYTPEGGRPAGMMPGEALYLPRSLSSHYAESFGKSPFQWLTQPARSNDGQWFIDPTWTLRQRYRVPASPDWSYEYCYNVPLGIDRRMDTACMPLNP